MRVHVMIVNTSRFGELQIDHERVISFQQGILGFPRYRGYALIQPGEDSSFYWLQSVDTPDLAFVVTDPVLFVPSYKVHLRPEHMQELGLSTLDGTQVFVIVNKRGNVLTGNLQGPLVVNVDQCVGTQLVLSDRRYTTRFALLELPSEVEAVPA